MPSPEGGEGVADDDGSFGRSSVRFFCVIFFRMVEKLG
jgi:hypothetical protein